MYTPLQLGLKYARYYCTASNGKGHGIHSPFVFELVTRVLNDRTVYADYGPVETLRQQLLQDRRVVEVDDFGAGSVTGLRRQRRVCGIARSSLKPPKYAQLLYRLVRHLQPRRILELGTSLGITTAYLAKGAPGAEVVSLEGAPAVAKLAAANLAALQADNTAIVSGNFDSTLAQVLAANALPFDFVFVDGNHRYEPSVRYFRQLAEQAGPDTVLVFDDIHWSREMEEAWNEICSASGVRLTIDLFFIGLVFFRTEQLEREHFRIRF